MRLVIVLLITLLLPLPASARDGVSAAVLLRGIDVDVVFEDGARHERHLARAGIEYWEPVAENIQAGFSIGYSESEGREAARPLEALAGNYGGLGLRFDAPVSALFALKGGVEVLLQRDRRTTSAFEFETRLRETRAEFGPVLRYGIMEFALGASWRDLDYRETVTRDAGETVRHADAAETSGRFAVLGLYTENDGILGLRYDAGTEAGWSLRFERTF